jgi:hypothetical protein
VIAVGARPHVEDSGDRAEIEFAIKMREQLVIARALPAQAFPQRIGIDRRSEQTGLAEIVFSRGLGDLGSRGEMDKAVTRIVGTALVDALPFGLAPGRGRTDFVDCGHFAGIPCFSLSLLGFSPECGVGRRP